MARSPESVKSPVVHYPRTGSVESRDVIQAQRRIQASFDTLTRKPHVVDSILLTDLPLAAGVSNRVKHKLGRAWRGYWVVKQNAPAMIWDVSAEDTDAVASQFLPLGVTDDVTVDLVVF